MPTDRPLPADLFGWLFLLSQHLTRAADEHLAPLGITGRQWLLLAVLTERFPAGPPTLSEAAAEYGTSRQNVAGLAGQLARRGWVRLEPDPDDRRAVRIHLTEAVRAFDDPDVDDRARSFLDEAFAALTPAQMATMRDLARRCVAHLAAWSPPPPAPGPRSAALAGSGSGVGSDAGRAGRDGAGREARS